MERCMIEAARMIVNSIEWMRYCFALLMDLMLLLMKRTMMNMRLVWLAAIGLWLNDTAPSLAEIEAEKQRTKKKNID